MKLFNRVRSFRPDGWKRKTKLPRKSGPRRRVILSLRRERRGRR